MRENREPGLTKRLLGDDSLPAVSEIFSEIFLRFILPTCGFGYFCYPGVRGVAMRRYLRAVGP